MWIISCTLFYNASVRNIFITCGYTLTVHFVRNICVSAHSCNYPSVKHAAVAQCIKLCRYRSRVWRNIFPIFKKKKTSVVFSVNLWLKGVQPDVVFCMLCLLRCFFAHIGFKEWLCELL